MRMEVQIIKLNYNNPKMPSECSAPSYKTRTRKKMPLLLLAVVAFRFI